MAGPALWRDLRHVVGVQRGFLKSQANPALRERAFD
jgi:hypothetical protein